MADSDGIGKNVIDNSAVFVEKCLYLGCLLRRKSEQIHMSDQYSAFENEGFFRAILDSISSPVFITDDDMRILYSNLHGRELMPWSGGLKIKNRCGDLMRCAHAVDEKKDCGKTAHCDACPIRCAVQLSYNDKRLVRTKSQMQVWRNNSKQDLFLLITTAPFEYDGRDLVLLSIADISDLIEREKAGEILTRKRQELDEANIAFEVLLRKHAKEKVRLQENITLNITQMLLPLIHKLKQTRLTDLQESYLSHIVTTIREITSPFYRTLSGEYFGLTPMEIQVADLIRMGKSSKEIATLLDKSVRAIDFHRHNIRRKVGITNKKESLKKVLSRFN